MAFGNESSHSSRQRSCCDRMARATASCSTCSDGDCRFEALLTDIPSLAMLWLTARCGAVAREQVRLLLPRTPRRCTPLAPLQRCCGATGQVEHSRAMWAGQVEFCRQAGRWALGPAASCAATVQLEGTRLQASHTRVTNIFSLLLFVRKQWRT